MSGVFPAEPAGKIIRVMMEAASFHLRWWSYASTSICLLKSLSRTAWAIWIHIRGIIDAPINREDSKQHLEKAAVLHITAHHICQAAEVRADVECMLSHSTDTRHLLLESNTRLNRNTVNVWCFSVLFCQQISRRWQQPDQVGCQNAAYAAAHSRQLQPF